MTVLWFAKTIWYTFDITQFTENYFSNEPTHVY